MGRLASPWGPWALGEMECQLALQSPKTLSNGHSDVSEPACTIRLPASLVTTADKPGIYTH